MPVLVSRKRQARTSAPTNGTPATTRRQARKLRSRGAISTWGGQEARLHPHRDRPHGNPGSFLARRRITSSANVATADSNTPVMPTQRTAGAQCQSQPMPGANVAATKPKATGDTLSHGTATAFRTTKACRSVQCPSLPSPPSSRRLSSSWLPALVILQKDDGQADAQWQVADVPRRPWGYCEGANSPCCASVFDGKAPRGMSAAAGNGPPRGPLPAVGASPSGATP